MLFAEVVKFDIDFKYQKNGQLQKSKYKIRSKLGENFSLQKGNVKIKFHAKRLDSLKDSQDLIYISAEVIESVKGKEKVIAEPAIVTKMNTEATVRMEEEEDFFELNLKPILI